MPAPASEIYLDYNATTPLLPVAAAAARQAMAEFGNPSSVHARGRRAKALIEEAREKVAKVVNVAPQQIIFTSGGTESNGLALRGLEGDSSSRVVIASAIEHPSVLAHVAETNRIPVTTKGVIDLDALEDRLQKASSTTIVAVMLANNETGVIQPVAEVAALSRKYGALVHCDGVQGPGKLEMDFNRLDVDTLSLSAHKFGGLKGAGALIVRDGVKLAPQMLGGGQEKRKRSGTENVTGIAAFGAAAAAEGNIRRRAPEIERLRDSLQTAALSECPSAIVYGVDAPRMCNTLCIGLPGVSAEIQLMRLDLAGVAVSAGSACSSGKIAPSHVLTAMGAETMEARCAIRISLGWGTGQADIASFMDAWRPLAAQAAA